MCTLQAHTHHRITSHQQVYPHLLAVAASDAFVRVFDRRMLSPGDLSYGLAQFDTPLFCMAPPHLAIPSIGACVCICVCVCVCVCVFVFVYCVCLCVMMCLCTS